jgi:hypothetical protein
MSTLKFILVVCLEDAWRALCAYWASPNFVEKSRMKRANRQAGPRVTQRYGADGHFRLARRMVHVYYFNLFIMCLLAISQFLLCQEAQSGVAPSYIETYIRGHLSADPTQPELLCSENTT